MKLLRLLACLALATTANAQFSVSGPPSFIPSSGTGDSAGWDTSNVDHDFTQTSPPGMSTVTVPVPVTCIDSVEIEGLIHTWIGDGHGVLVDPNGVGYNLWLRPNLAAGQACCGNGGNYVVGTYIFVPPGQANGPLPLVGDATPGSYDQSWDTGNGVVWPNGDENVFNTPLDQITGPAGTWTLKIYDWFANDTGSFFGWTLHGNGGCPPGTIGTNYECPSTVPNSTNLPGLIVATGSEVAVNNNVTLTVSQLPPSQFGYFLNSPLQNVSGFNPPGSQGLLCVGPSMIGRYNMPSEIYNTGAAGQGSLALDLTLTPIPSAPFTTSIQAGETWYFTSWFRDNNPGPTSNFTDAVCITFL